MTLVDQLIVLYRLIVSVMTDSSIVVDYMEVFFCSAENCCS